MNEDSESKNLKQSNNSIAQNIKGKLKMFEKLGVYSNN